MSRQKRTRTKSTRQFPSRHVRRMKQVKREVAAEAARIIATEGQYNYHAAKRKAAIRIGVAERLALPSNIEVREALGHYLRLYGGEEHFANLHAMRVTAEEVMEFMRPFGTRLVGAVLDGTATCHARVTLQLFSDIPDNVIHHLMERNVPFRQEQRQIRWHGDEHRTVPLIVLDRPPYTVELMILGEIQVRQATPCPIDGKPQKRAGLEEVRRLISSEAARPALEAC